MNKKTHFSGAGHPMFRHGRYVGQKRSGTRQPGTTKAVRKWLLNQKGKFTSEDVKAALPQFTAKQISNALHGLNRRGELKDLEHVGNQHKIWEVMQ